MQRKLCELFTGDIQLHTFKPGIKGGAWAKIRSFNQCANVTEHMVKLIIEEISMLFDKAQPSYHSAKLFYTSLHMCVCLGGCICTIHVCEGACRGQKRAQIFWN